MSPAESGPSSEQDPRILKTETFYPEIMPDAWKDKYISLRVGWDRKDPYKEVLYGIYKEGGKEKEEVLPMEVLVDSVEAVYGFTSRRWPDDQLEQNRDLAEVARENTALRAHLYLLRDANEQQKSEINELKDQNARYQTQIRSLTENVATLTGRVSKLEKGEGVVANTTPGDPKRVDENTTDRTGTGPKEAGRATTSPPSAAAGDVVNAGVPASPATPAENVDAVNPKDEIQGPDRGNTSRWNRIREKIGMAVLGWQVRAHNGAYRIVDRRGDERYVVENDAQLEKYYEAERRATGAVIVGAVAGLGAGVLITWLLLKTGHSHEDIIHNGKIPSDQFNSLVGRIDAAKKAANDAKTAIIEKQNALSIQESKHHAQEMRLLHHLNRHLHHLNGVKIGNIDISNFHSDSFYGKTPHEAVRNMFGVLRDNNIHAHGLSGHKISQITNDLMRSHWHIASGMKAGNQQNVVDVAQDWADGRTQNWRASGLQGLRRINGTSDLGWERFIKLAARHGVTFSRS
jgi:hypothetical protein